MLFFAYLAIVLAPLGAAWAQGLAPRTPWDELASGLGLLALAMILVEFLQLGRFRAVTARVGSDVIMRSHQLLARAALVFAVLHPFFYVSPRDAAPAWDASRQTVVDYSWEGLWPGIAAWLLLGGVVAMAIGRDVCGVRYQHWRLLHGLGAAVLAGVGVLHALRAGRYSADPVLGWMWVAMLAIALGALLWVYVAAPLLRSRRPWRVADVTRVAERTWSVTLAPQFKGPFRYRAGQFAWLNIGHSVFSLDENPFSIASAPSAGNRLEFLIKELGDSTAQIGNVANGTRAWVEGPHGHLTLGGRDDARGIALIAGGVGVAPLLGILRELAATEDPRPTVLIYGNRHAGQIAYADELETLSQHHGTEVVHVLSEPPADWTGPTGMIDAALLRAHFDRPERHGWLYVLCGPPPMLRNVEDSLIALGVPAANILSEQFVYY
ncbi:ferredoxin reductase family protein [Roseovarius salinarum]|uniref:ferredoxin reductase family protein n=1 Tax=Roseovarius salinarum TaxID=1981892 RepID=UPI0018E408BA|nr:ferredoxin reductase family protein [Roseovarius salinarum]